MPTSKTKMKSAVIAAKMAALPSVPKELMDQFVSGPMAGDAVNTAAVAFKSRPCRTSATRMNIGIAPVALGARSP